MAAQFGLQAALHDLCIWYDLLIILHGSYFSSARHCFLSSVHGFSYAKKFSLSNADFSVVIHGFLCAVHGFRLWSLDRLILNSL